MALGLLPPVVAELMMDITEFSASADKAQAKMTGLASSGSAMFDKIGKATVLGIAGIGVASIKMASDFETQMTRLYTAAGAPKAAVEASYGAVLKLADSVGESGTAMAEALYHPVSAGLDLATSLQVVKYAAQEAQISGASLDDTTYSLSSVMKAFNQNADQAHSTMGLLNSIVGQGDMRFQDFNVSVKNWAPTAAQMGISIQSMGAALAYLTDRGNSAEEASTRVTMGLTMMAYPAKQAGSILEGLGVASSDVTASSQAMTDVLKKAGVTQNQLATDLQQPDGIYVALTHLKTALNDAGVKGTEADAAISKIFGGGRSDKAILSLLQNLDGLKTKFQDIGAGAGQFDQAWKDTQDTFGFRVKQLGADAENLGISIGTKLIPVVEDVVGWFAKHKLAAEGLATVIAGLLTLSLVRFAQTLTTTVLEAIAKTVTAIAGLGKASEAAAAEQEAANVSAQSWTKSLGNSLPVIGTVITGAAMLGTWLGHLTQGSIDATAALNNMSNKLLDLAAGTQTTGVQLDQMAELAMKVGGSMQTQFIAPIDKGLAELASGGHADQAKQALADIDAKLTAAGQSADKFNSKLTAYNDALGTLALQSREAALKTDQSTTALGANADALGADTSATNDAADATSGLTDAVSHATDLFTQMSDAISSSGALHAFQRDLLSVNDTLQQNGTKFSESSLDGLKNMEAFRNAGDEILKYRDAQIKAAGGTNISNDALQAINKTSADQTQQLLDVWEKLTGNKQAVDDYAKSLGLIPKDMVTAVALTGVANALSELDALNAKRAQLGAPYVPSLTGGRAALAGGGPVSGPGTSTSDSIPAALSDGEYVIRAAAASSLGTSFLDALNTTGAVPAAAASGPAFGGSAYGSFGAQGYGAPAINVYVELDGQSVSGAVRSATLQYDQRNSSNGLSLAGRGFQ